MKGVLYSETVIGETRRLLTDQRGRPFRLELDRWSWEGTRARLGEVYLGRCSGRDAALGGWFIDLGVGPPGFLAARNVKLEEGEAVAVRVKAEARGDKGPTLARASISLAQSQAKAPIRIEGAPQGQFCADVDYGDAVSSEDGDDAIAAAIETVLTPSVPIEGGGWLAIEPTRAMVAVDVDGAGRTSKGDRRSFARDLNLAAADEIGRQIALRRLGGLIAVDFIHMDRKDDRDVVVDALQTSIALHTGQKCQTAPMSRFGVVEASLAWCVRPIAEAYRGAEAVEATAIEALRRLVREGAARGGRPLELRCAPTVARWLNSDRIPWRAALTDRIGPRFNIVEDPAVSDDFIDVRSL